VPAALASVAEAVEATNATQPSGACAPSARGPEVESPIEAALWSSMLLVVGALCGYYALHICDAGQQESFRMLRITDASSDWREILQQMPESVSKAIHLTNSPHGSVFKAFMLLMALLIFCSAYPKHELIRSVHSFELESVFQALRSVCPGAGIMMVIFIPMSHDYVEMLERFKQPGYAITDVDKAVYLASKVQEDLHSAAGFIAFGLTPIMEAIALVKAFVCFFDMAGEDDMVRWKDGTLASRMWLLMTCIRVFVICGSDLCLAAMQYEMSFEPSNRFRKNPNHIYLPERAAIYELTNYVLLLGMSMWFVDAQWFATRPVVAKVGCVAIASLSATAIVVWTVWLFWWTYFKEFYLSDDKMREQIMGSVEVYKARVAHNAPSMKSLEELRRKWVCYSGSMELSSTVSGEEEEEGNWESSDPEAGLCS